MGEYLKVINGLSVKADVASKMQPVQDAALFQANNLCQGVEPPFLAAEYIRTTTIATDSCKRFEGYLKQAPDELTKTFLFFTHALNFGCPDLSKHTSIVI